MSASKSVPSHRSRFTVEKNWFISGEVIEVKAISTAANTTLSAEHQQMLCASLTCSRNTFLVQREKAVLESCAPEVLA